MANKKKNIDWTKILNILMMTIALGIIIFSCVYQNNLLKLIEMLPTLEIFWTTVAIVAVVFSWLLEATIIKLIVNSVFAGHFNLMKAFKVSIIGQFYLAITPMGLAGQPMMIVALSRYGVSAGTATSILVRKFLIYQVTVTCYSLFAIITNFGFFSSVASGFMVVALLGFCAQAFIVLILALFSLSHTVAEKIVSWFFRLITKLKFIKNPKKIETDLRQQLDFYLENNRAMNTNKRLTVKLYVLTFLQITFVFSIPFLIYKSFGYDGFPYLKMVSAEAFVSMAASCVPLPGGSGMNEGGFVVIFGLFFGSETISQAMLLWRFLTYYLVIIVGIFFAKLNNKKSDTMEEVKEYEST